MEHRWMTPVIVGASVVVGAAVYLARPVVSHTDAHRQQQAGHAEGTAALRGTAAAQCFAAGDPGATKASLDEKYRWAHTLVDQKLYDAALPDLRDIAARDPGYPGINLDISDALLQLKQTSDAQAAINLQTTISACLSKLSSDALDTYCSAEMPQSSLEDCRSHLAYLDKAADLQAALVRLEAAHLAAADEAAGPAQVAAVSGPHQRTGDVGPRPATTEHIRVEHTAPAHRKTGNNSLIDGDGTDMSLGAYSKPQ